MKTVKPNMGLMDPKVDFVFKSIFGNEKHPQILISFLNAVFGYNTRDNLSTQITKIKIENPYLDKSMVEDKFSVLDIRATLNTNEIVNVEIQIKSPGNMEKRLLYYLSKMLSSQLCDGEHYDKLKRCVSIGVLDFNLIENTHFHNKFNFKSNNDNLEFSNLLELHTIELPKLIYDSTLDTNNLLIDWALFLTNPKEEGMPILQKKVPEIKEAMEVLEMLSHDKKARVIYEQRQKSLRDKQSSLHHAHQKGLQEGMQEGVQDGIQQGIKQVAIKLIKVGMEDDFIIKATGLTKDQVDLLRKNLSPNNK